MTVYISNLVAGLDKGLDHTELLLEMTRPFGGRVGIEFFIHTYSEAYMERMERIGEWAGKLPLALHGPFLHVEATSAPGTAEYGVLTASYGRAFALAQRFGCGHMVFHDHERFVRPEQKMDLQAQCLENIGELIRLAKPWGVRLLLENLALPVKGTPLFDQEEYIGLFDRFPDADCLIDVGHLGVAGWDMETVIGSLAGRITGYHLHNNNGTDDSHRRIRDGVIDYDRFFRQVHGVELFNHIGVNRRKASKLCDHSGQQNDGQVTWVLLDPRVPHGQNLIPRVGQAHDSFPVHIPIHIHKSSRKRKLKFCLKCHTLIPPIIFSDSITHRLQQTRNKTPAPSATIFSPAPPRKTPPSCSRAYNHAGTGSRPANPLPESGSCHSPAAPVRWPGCCTLSPEFLPPPLF